MVNLAAPVLGDIYGLMVAALGDTVGWWVGHLALVGLLALIAWAVRNHEEIRHGFELSTMKVWSIIVVILVTVGQYWLYQTALGFPASGAFLTALSVSGYLFWQWYQLEPQKA